MKKKNLTKKTKITNKDGVETIAIDTKEELKNVANSLQLVKLKCDIITNKFLCHKEQEVVEAILEMAEEFKKDKKEDIKSDNSFEALGELVEEYVKDKFFSAEILESIVFIFQTCSAIAIADSFNNDALKQVYDDDQNFTIALGITVLAEGIYSGAKRILTGDDEEEEPEEDLTGQKFGNLTVLRKATEEEVAEAEANGALDECCCENEENDSEIEEEEEIDEYDLIHNDRYMGRNSIVTRRATEEDVKKLGKHGVKLGYPLEWRSTIEEDIEEAKANGTFEKRMIKTYKAYEDTLGRYEDPDHAEYKDYGGKGVGLATDCDWKEPKGKGFENFLKHNGLEPE